MHLRSFSLCPNSFVIQLSGWFVIDWLLFSRVGQQNSWLVGMVGLSSFLFAFLVSSLKHESKLSAWLWLLFFLIWFPPWFKWREELHFNFSLLFIFLLLCYSFMFLFTLFLSLKWKFILFYVLYGNCCLNESSLGSQNQQWTGFFKSYEMIVFVRFSYTNHMIIMVLPLISNYEYLCTYIDYFDMWFVYVYSKSVFV